MYSCIHSLREKDSRSGITNHSCGKSPTLFCDNSVATDFGDATVRIALVGATGHIGTWLVPMLAAQGHDVVAVSRSLRQPYHLFAGWEKAEAVQADRAASIVPRSSAMVSSEDSSHRSNAT